MNDAPPRLMTAQRQQIELRSFDLDALIAEDHRARLLWEAVERLDLAEYYAAIEARGSVAGRPAHDPKVLLVLWLYATSEGIGSARHLERLCERDHAYQWICGGLRPNHHSLSDFRGLHGDKLDALMTQLLASFMKQKLITLKRVAQDGTKVRALAGQGSFRRKVSLGECLKKAQAQVAQLKKEVDLNPSVATTRQLAARQRAAKERQAAIEKALAQMPEAEKRHDRHLKRHPKKKTSKNQDARVSTTDPEARLMKMSNGGFNPAFNVQFATDTASRLIVGVEVTNEGSDVGQMVPMMEQIQRRTKQRPKEYLVDGGYFKREAFEKMEQGGTQVYAPLRHLGVDRGEPKRGDTAGVVAWRQRMKNADTAQIYKQRAATAETVHADLKNWRGLRQLPVRGQKKAQAVMLLYAMTYNLLRLFALQREPLAVPA